MPLKAKSYNLKAIRGFTLIEIMVAVSLFAIVAVITTGALVTASEVNRKAQAIKIAMDNVAFAMDSMVFNLREGANYHCLTQTTGALNGYLTGAEFGNENPCYADGQGIVFGDRREGRGGSDKRIIYRFEGDSIQFASTDLPQYVSITSSEIGIERFRFYVPDAQSSGEAPRVTIVIEGTVPGKTPTKFNLQTTVKQGQIF